MKNRKHKIEIIVGDIDRGCRLRTISLMSIRLYCFGQWNAWSVWSPTTEPGAGAQRWVSWVQSRVPEFNPQCNHVKWKFNPCNEWLLSHYFLLGLSPDKSDFKLSYIPRPVARGVWGVTPWSLSVQNCPQFWTYFTKKVHFLPKSIQASPLSPKSMQKSTFSKKKKVHKKSTISKRAH